MSGRVPRRLSRERAVDNETRAWIKLATAHVFAGGLDAAQAATQEALATRLRTDPIDMELCRLHSSLTEPAVATSRCWPRGRATPRRRKPVDATTASVLPSPGLTSTRPTR